MPVQRPSPARRLAQAGALIRVADAARQRADLGRACTKDAPSAEVSTPPQPRGALCSAAPLNPAERDVLTSARWTAPVAGGFPSPRLCWACRTAALVSTSQARLSAPQRAPHARHAYARAPRGARARAHWPRAAVASRMAPHLRRRPPRRNQPRRAPLAARAFSAARGRRFTLAPPDLRGPRGRARRDSRVFSLFGPSPRAPTAPAQALHRNGRAARPQWRCSRNALCKPRIA